MTELTSSQRKFLRSMAHHLSALIKVGSKGLTDGVIKGADAELGRHELIKIKFSDFKDEKLEIAGKIATATGAEVVGNIGNVVMLYRYQKDDEKRQINLPKK